MVFFFILKAKYEMVDLKTREWKMLWYLALSLIHIANENVMVDLTKLSVTWFDVFDVWLLATSVIFISFRI